MRGPIAILSSMVIILMVTLAYTGITKNQIIEEQMKTIEDLQCKVYDLETTTTMYKRLSTPVKGNR